MKSWNYEPAKDLDLGPVERAKSLKRESGIWSTCGHLTWHSVVKLYTAIYHRLDVKGRENLTRGASVRDDCQSHQPSR